MSDVQSLLLQVISSALFGKSIPTVADNQIIPLANESKVQAVYPLVFSILDNQIQEKLSLKKYEEYSEDFFRYTIAGTQNFAEHGELHELMTANDIPYVTIKGLASAMYYPEPSLRSMGDVDFLVYPEDLDRAGKLLESAGFTIDHGEKEKSKHIAYHRPPLSIWEMHRNVNGVPYGEIGERIQEEINRTVETSETLKIDGTTCRVPDKFHHGLIILLHTASHLTSEGVGLRHLCDWVVFTSVLSDTTFRKIFEMKLKSFGLWRFAQVLTLLGNKYLDAPKRAWALEAVESHKVEDGILEGLINDILSGGNFGFKDRNRYREIKYISDRKIGTVGKKGIVRQGFKTMNEKIRTGYRIIGNYKILYPIGYLAESGKYIKLLIVGKRKASGTKQMLKEAVERKRLYNKLSLFDDTNLTENHSMT